MTQTKERRESHVLRRPDFWMVWRCHDIPCVYCYFSFSNKRQKAHLDENDFHHCYGNFFRIAILKVILSQLFSKQHFERHHTVEDFMDLDQDRCEFFHQDLSKHNQTKVLENYQLHKNPSVHLKEHCTAQKQMAFHLFLYAFFFSKNYFLNLTQCFLAC